MKITIPVTLEVADDHISHEGYVLNRDLEPIRNAASGEPLTPLQWLVEYESTPLTLRAFLALPSADDEWIRLTVGSASVAE
jgi:hypothetical protein